MTPERRARLEARAKNYLGGGTQCYVSPAMAADDCIELLAEIDRLNKVVEQACEIIGELLGDEDRPLKTRPALAAELERRSKS